MKCCSLADHIISVYSLTGELLQTYGTEGNGDAGRLKFSRFCDYYDAGGSVLIADHGNNRLQVMTEQGEFSIVELQPSVTQPCGAALLDNHLYVTSHSNKAIRKYMFAHDH